MPPKDDLTSLADELLRIAEIPKCQGCSCFLDVLEQFHRASLSLRVRPDLDGRGNLVVRSPRSARDDKLPGGAQVASLIENFQVTHGCIGCEPCYPVPIANALPELGEEAISCASCHSERLVPSAAEGSEEALPDTTASLHPWPPEPGNYLLGNQSAPIAISTLASKTLPQPLAQELGTENFALIGITETENIGVEKVVKNIVSNRNIRFLILSGQESRGHLSGATLAALRKNGLDKKRRVVGSRATTPFLKNLTPDLVRIFRDQVQLIDMIACQEVPLIIQATHRCLRESPGPFQDAVGAQSSEPALVSASPPPAFVRDKSGFFIILLDRQAGKILLEHYDNDRRRTLVIEGKDAVSLYSTAIERRLLSRLDHAAYLGKELARAEIALTLGLDYVQDAAQSPDDL